MLNKFFKTIHNKYSRLFKFIFFLRYLFATFFLSIFLFLIIPIFLNHEKKAELIKNYLEDNYDFEINEYENLKYKAFPLPRLEFKKTQIKFLKSNANFNVNYLKVYPKILSIYNPNYFEADKIIFKENYVNLEISDFFIFIEQLSKQRKKISFNGLNFKIVKDSKLVIKLENLFFSNFGYKKNSIEGKIFGEKFEAKLENNLELIKFKLLNLGITSNLELNKKTKKGTFKSKILNTNLKFNFEYDNKGLKMFNSYFRSKNLSFDNETLLTLKPFFEIESNFKLDEFNSEILKKINFVKLLEIQNIVKKINSKNTITYKPKKFSKSFFNNLNLKLDLANGRLNYEKDFLIEKNFFKCKGDLNLSEDYPLLYFDCSAIIKDKKRLLKKFLINIKNSNEVSGLKVKGNLNILKKKIDFEQISVNEKKFPKDDLKYFKNSFENILFNKGFLKMFEIKKIKNYILEVI